MLHNNALVSKNPCEVVPIVFMGAVTDIVFLLQNAVWMVTIPKSENARCGVFEK